MTWINFYGNLGVFIIFTKQNFKKIKESEETFKKEILLSF